MPSCRLASGEEEWKKLHFKFSRHVLTFIYIKIFDLLEKLQKFSSSGNPLKQTLRRRDKRDNTTTLPLPTPERVKNRILKLVIKDYPENIFTIPRTILMLPSCSSITFDSCSSRVKKF